MKIDDRFGGFGTLMVMVGREDYICGDVSYDLDKKLDEVGIEHVFYDVFGIRHNPVRQNGLYNFVIKIRDNMD